MHNTASFAQNKRHRFLLTWGAASMLFGANAAFLAQGLQAAPTSANITPTCQMLTIVNGQAGQINLPPMPALFHSATGSITIKRAGMPAETLPVQATTDTFNGVYAGPFKSINGQTQVTAKGLKLAVLKMVYPPQPSSKATVRIGGNARNGNNLLIDILRYTGPALKISGKINLCVQ
jgi:hypothetical protein